MQLPRLSPTTALELISKLAEDDAYRFLFENDPAMALREIGVSVKDSEQLKRCYAVKKLATKEAIASARSELHLMLTSKITQIVPALDASPTLGRTLIDMSKFQQSQTAGYCHAR